MAQTWEFGAFLDDSLRDRFVCGLLRVNIQRYFFSEDKNLTFQRAVDHATSLEAALANAPAAHSKPESNSGFISCLPGEQRNASAVTQLTLPMRFRTSMRLFFLQQEREHYESLPKAARKIAAEAKANSTKRSKRASPERASTVRVQLASASARRLEPSSRPATATGRSITEHSTTSGATILA